MPYESMDSPKEGNNKLSKHCQTEGIKICTRCGSTKIKIEGETMTCIDCNAILCYSHKDGERVR